MCNSLQNRTFQRHFGVKPTPAVMLKTGFKIQ
jgi:hypothetical protein